MSPLYQAVEATNFSVDDVDVAAGTRIDLLELVLQAGGDEARSR